MTGATLKFLASHFVRVFPGAPGFGWIVEHESDGGASRNSWPSKGAALQDAVRIVLETNAEMVVSNSGEGA